MGETGEIGPDERVELLDGELIPMPPIGPEHGYGVSRLHKLLERRFGERAWITSQNPVTLDNWSEPQPDLVLAALPEVQYRAAHPTPANALLVVEVAVSSLAYDRGKKLRAYARRGVREYWIVDLVHERVDVYRDPRGERFGEHRRAGYGEAFALLAFPEDPVAVDDVLPPRESG